MLLRSSRLARSFTIVDAEGSPASTRPIVEALGPTHVIAVRQQLDPRYYLFRTRDFLDALSLTGDVASVTAALGLDAMSPTDVLDAYSDEAEASRPAIVVDGERIIGFVDPLTGDAEVVADFDVALELEEILEQQGTSRGADSPRVDVVETVATLAHEFPPQLNLGRKASLLMFLSADRSAGPSLTTALSPGTSVDLIVKSLRGLELVGCAEGTLQVPEQGESEPLRFEFNPVEPGPAAIRVYAFVGMHRVGTLIVESTIVASRPLLLADPAEVSVRRRVALPNGTGEAPDLLLTIVETGDGAAATLAFTLRTREPDGAAPKIYHFEREPLGTNTQSFVQEFYRAIEELPVGSVDQRNIAARELETMGASLSRAVIPKDLLDLLWTYRDRVRSVQIQSDEPWIPWELCRLQGREDGKIAEGPFFGDAFAMTRWLPQFEDKTSLSWRKIALVVPEHTGLKQAARERAFLRKFDGPDRQVENVPADLLKIQTAFASGMYDGWHFTCHGRSNPSADLAELELNAGQILRPRHLAGVNENLGKSNPLVFISACEAGRTGLALSGLGGWAVRFLEAGSRDYAHYGAAAFVGAYWMIEDKLAADFAEAFYLALVRDAQPIGEAARRARVALTSSGDPTRLAYTVFANPLARVQ